MALMLRKAAEEVLEQYDLDAYHADIHSGTKYMKLFTPCGKSFATIHGVQFSRLHPTQAEIDYACDLLEEWCSRNQLKIEKYLAAFEILQRMEKPDQFLEFPNGNKIRVNIATGRSYYDENTGGWVEPVRGVDSLALTYNEVDYKLDKDLRVRGVSYSKDKAPALGAKVTIPKSFLNKAVALMEKVELWVQADKTTQDILSELNSCKE